MDKLCPSTHPQFSQQKCATLTLNYFENRITMCGVAGLLRTDARQSDQISPHLLEKMSDTMIHRGPDGSGVWVNDEARVGLSHRRLSIIDLADAAGQPMHDASGELTVVYNGEIYNHVELKKQLIGLGHTQWLTDHSDTEVLLTAYKEWGIECLSRLRGIFAFGLWDSQRKRLFLARDRIGVKPLYYSDEGPTFSFASEIKAILAGSGVRPHINPAGLRQYLGFMTTTGPDTIFKGIHKLQPGHWMTVDQNGTKVSRKYWDVLEDASRLTETPEHIADQLITELRESVALRQVSDRPVGIFLSGGIDSSLNAALFSESTSGNVQTFSIGYAGSDQGYQNETELAKEFAAQIGAENQRSMLTRQDLQDVALKLAWHQDEPNGDPVCVPVHYVSKLARENGVVVCQVGEGSDELFHGYDSWAKYRKYQSIADSVPKFILQAMSRLTGPVGLDPTRSDMIARSAQGHPIFMGGALGLTDPQINNLLSPDVQRELKGISSYDAIAPYREQFESSAWDKSNFAWMSYLDLKFRLPELLLMRVDKMSMATSVEARVPFLDHELVTLAMSMTDSTRLLNGSSKGILKKAAEGLVPDSVLYRQKQGFGLPMDDWLPGIMDDIGREAIESMLKDTDMFNDGVMNELLSPTEPAKNRWILLNLAFWWSQYKPST
jgi:asparagine synthase (glutamine-hydrolysing)